MSELFPQKFWKLDNYLNPILFFDTFAPKSIVKALTEKFARGHYERHKRLNPKSLIKMLQQLGFQPQNVKQLGFPPFQPWIYQYSSKRPPWYAYIWILFDKITNQKPLNILKEVIIFYAIKRKQSLHYSFRTSQGYRPGHTTQT